MHVAAALVYPSPFLGCLRPPPSLSPFPRRPFTRPTSDALVNIVSSARPALSSCAPSPPPPRPSMLPAPFLPLPSPLPTFAPTLLWPLPSLLLGPCGSCPAPCPLSRGVMCLSSAGAPCLPAQSFSHSPLALSALAHPAAFGYLPCFPLRPHLSALALPAKPTLHCYDCCNPSARPCFAIYYVARRAAFRGARASPLALSCRRRFSAPRRHYPIHPLSLPLRPRHLPDWAPSSILFAVQQSLICTTPRGRYVPKLPLSPGTSPSLPSARLVHHPWVSRPAKGPSAKPARAFRPSECRRLRLRRRLSLWTISLSTPTASDP